jgi:DNA-binding transcriptional MerR regulator
MMYKHSNIGQLARAAGVPVSTLRYYERVGLLAPAGRAHNNYRFYTQDTLQMVRFIRAAQATGFTLEDVRALLTLWDGQSALCKDVQPLVAKRLAEVTQRLQDIRHMQRILTSMLAMAAPNSKTLPVPS